MKGRDQTTTRPESFRDYPEPTPPRQDRPPGHEYDDPAKFRPAPALVMPGTTAQIKDEVSRVSPEGAPADAKSGPGTLLLTVGGLFCLLVVVSITIGMFVGWATAAAVMGVGTLGLLFNPVVIAAFLRAREREGVAEHHLPPDKRRYHPHNEPTPRY